MSITNITNIMSTGATVMSIIITNNMSTGATVMSIIMNIMAT